MASAAQGQVIAAFEAASIPDAGAFERRADTALSHVFLFAKRAYKIKRAVTAPFVDLSTLAHRRASCEAELEVNKALAPELYHCVRPVFLDVSGALAFEGDGSPVEYAVEMERFADTDLFDQMAQDGRLSVRLIEDLASRIAAFHASQPAQAGFGHAADYKRVIEDLLETEAEAAEQWEAGAPARGLYDALNSALAHAGGLIEARRRAGCVRRGHGDLHLGNICLWRGAATPFDALEFSERLATTDRLYDLAFLLMDLRYRGLAAHANAAFNAYWNTGREEKGAHRLLPFFMALRAAVRCAVSVQRNALETAHAYRRLGLALLEPAHPVLLAVGGLSGTGKSVLARALAPLLQGPCGARLLRTDVLRLQGEGAPEYSAAARGAVYDKTAAAASQTLAAGAACIFDATFQDAAWRKRARSAAGPAPFLGLWLRASADVRAERVAQRAGDVSQADARVARAQADDFAGEEGWAVIDASGTPENTLTGACAALAKAGIEV